MDKRLLLWLSRCWPTHYCAVGGESLRRPKNSRVPLLGPTLPEVRSISRGSACAYQTPGRGSEIKSRVVALNLTLARFPTLSRHCRQASCLGRSAAGSRRAERGPPPRVRGRAGRRGAAGERGAARRGRLLPRGGGAAGSGGGGSPRTRLRTRGRPLRAPPGRTGSAGRWRGGGGCCCCAASCWGCWAAAAGSAAAGSTATAGWTGRAATTTASSAPRALTLRPPPSAAAPARCATAARPPRRGWSREAAPTTGSLRSRRSAPVSAAGRGAGRAQPRAPKG